MDLRWNKKTLTQRRKEAKTQRIFAKPKKPHSRHPTTQRQPLSRAIPAMILAVEQTGSLFGEGALFGPLD